MNRYKLYLRLLKIVSELNYDIVDENCNLKLIVHS